MINVQDLAMLGLGYGMLMGVSAAFLGYAIGLAFNLLNKFMH